MDLRAAMEVVVGERDGNMTGSFTETDSVSEMTPTLFVLSCLNYQGYPGLRLATSPCHSAYFLSESPQILFALGAEMHVLGVSEEEGVRVGAEWVGGGVRGVRRER